MSAVHHSGALPREPDPDHQEPLGVATAAIDVDDTPVFGRKPEFGRIVARLLAARDQRTGMVALSGEAGIGKTLLMRKVSERAHHERFLVLWERMLEGDWQPSYHAWAEILRQAMIDLNWPMASDDPPEWAQTLLPILPRLSHIYPHLAPVANLSVQEERFRLPDAIVRCLYDLGQRRPLLIVLDDIQWSDPGSLRVLLHLGRSTHPAALMVLIAYRDDYVESKGSLSGILNQIRREARFEEIVLHGLSEDEIEQVMQSVGAESISSQVVKLVSEATQGNALFVHEIARHLIEEHGFKAPASAPGSPEVSELSIPESLRQVVDHRLGRLSATAQRMLRLAAVCTDGFDFPMLRALTSLDEEELLDVIDEALAARLIAPIGTGVERYDFQHSLVRRALYDGWSPSRRIRLHRALATSLEQVHHDARHLYAPALAVHYHISASVPGAEAGVPYALAAARDAARRSAPEQAATYLGMARDLATTLPVGQRAEIASALALAEANALWLDAALSSATDALQLLDEASASNGEKAVFLALIVTGLHDGGQARELWMPLLYRGLALVPPDDEVTWARLTLLIERFEPVSVGVINGSRWLGSDPRAISIARSGGDEELFARSLQPWDLWDREWTDHLSNLIATWQQPGAIIRALTVSGADWLYHHGEFRRAKAHFENLLVIAERYGSVPGQAEATVRLGIIHAVLGDLAQARGWERRASSLVERLGRGHRLHASLWWLRAMLCEIDGGDWNDVASFFVPYISDTNVGRRTIAFDDAALAALALAQSGHADQARVLLTPLIRILNRLEPTLWLLNGTVGYAASAVWALNASEYAGRLHQCAIGIIDAGHDDFPCSSNFHSLARMSALLGNTDEAHGWFEKARAHLDVSGQRPLRAIVDLDEATVLASGSYADRGDARTLAGVARIGFLDLGMTSWATRATALIDELERWMREAHAIPAGLTQRELEVVRLVARGYPDRQIGDDMFVSPRTVNAHVRNILAKTKLKNRTELSIWAVDQGLIRPDRGPRS